MQTGYERVNAVQGAAQRSRRKQGDSTGLQIEAS